MNFMGETTTGLQRRKCILDFCTESGGRYILDGNTGAVIATNEIIRKAIDLCATKSAKDVIDELAEFYPEKEVKGAVSFLWRWAGVYGGLYRTEESKKDVREKMQATTEADYREFVFAGHMSQMILTVTENCNFRCKYCYLSDGYKYTRNKSERAMPLDIGIRALDMFFNYVRPIAGSIPAKMHAVTFYGGEPLMVFGLLKKLIEYARAHCPTRLLLNLTTNGYLLTDEIASYLVEHDVKIAVSLDGAPKDHDRNRVTADGEGSFDVVYDNIKRFQRRHPDFAKTSLMLLSIYDCLTDLEANLRFFEENDMPIVAFVNPVASGNTDYYARFSEEDRRRHGEQVSRLLSLYKDYRKMAEMPPSYLHLLFASLAMIRLRSKKEDKRPFHAPYTSSCIPGHRIHVRVDGTLDMCERVNQMFPIGHVNTGLDFAAVRNVMRLYNSGVTEKCSDCPLDKLCPLCPAQCNNDCSFSSPVACADIHTRFRQDYGLYYSLCEHNANAFNDRDTSLLSYRLLYS